VLGALFDTLFPLACPGCGRSAAPICRGCANQLVPPVPTPPPPGVDAWFAPFAYAGPARELVARVKYRNVRAVVPWLADAMVAVVSGAELDRTARRFVVSWAPTTAAHRRRRGFDPAEVLARVVARRSGARCTSLLTRGPGPPQTGLGAAARRQGPRFSARTAVPARVLLVDDVATTGATLAAAAVALRSAGALEIVALTAARTPPPR
jgi:predicted amidophosphoribosyltransferase